MHFGTETICSLYQNALKYSYEFNFEKSYLKYIFTSYYVPKMLEKGIEQNKINELMNLVCNSYSFQFLDDDFLRPEVLQSICNTSNLSTSVFYDDYYSFIFSDYSSKILKWKQNRKISQKRAAKILKVSPVDLSNWERRISYPSRYQFKKLQEITLVKKDVLY